MSAHIALLCFGSNLPTPSTLISAVQATKSLGVWIEKGKIWHTPDYTSATASYYYNKVVLLSTTCTAEELRRQCKVIETLWGRTPDSKDKGIIPIDIDIISYDGVVLKVLPDFLLI